MLHIEKYNNTTIINNDIEEIIIDELINSLDNINPMINKITVKKSFNIYKRENRIPYGCEFIPWLLKILQLMILMFLIILKKKIILILQELDLSFNQITVIPVNY